MSEVEEKKTPSEVSAVKEPSSYGRMAMRFGQMHAACAKLRYEALSKTVKT